MTRGNSGWVLSPHGYLKINTDVAFKNGVYLAGFGVVIRDETGWIVAAV